MGLKFQFHLTMFSNFRDFVIFVFWHLFPSIQTFLLALISIYQELTDVYCAFMHSDNGMCLLFKNVKYKGG
jgi:hypothetical protein